MTPKSYVNRVCDHLCHPRSERYACAMLGLYRSSLSVSLVPLLAALAGVTTPGEANACSPDPCYESNRITDFTLTNEQVKPDGVLVFRARHLANGLSLEDALAYVDVEVLGPDDVAVQGTLEAIASSAVLWRPTAPLAPNAAHTVLVTVDNDALGLEHDPEWVNDKDWCGPNIILEQTIASTSGAFAPLQVTVSESQEVDSTELRGLDTLVCCDGAIPREEYLCGDIPDLYWTEGFCTSNAQRGRLAATFDVEPPASFGDDQLDNLMLRLHTGTDVGTGFPGDLTITRSAEEPFCSVVELINVATGDTVSSQEICVGDDVADQLGLLPLDPSAALGQECSGAPYVCEVNGEEWDPERCSPWTTPGDDGGDSDGGDGSDGSDGSDGDDGDGGEDGGLADDGIAGRGCGCQTSGGSSGPWGMAWGMLGLVLWRRRRR